MTLPTIDETTNQRSPYSGLVLISELSLVSQPFRKRLRQSPAAAEQDVSRGGTRGGHVASGEASASCLTRLALPRLPAHYQFLWDQGVRHLVSLTESKPPHRDSYPGLTLHRFRTPDFCPLAANQIDSFIELVDKACAPGEAVGVLCALGFGRASAMLACSLVKERSLMQEMPSRTFRVLGRAPSRTKSKEKQSSSSTNKRNKRPQCPYARAPLL